MNIDERLERLTERHEALAQSMELFIHQFTGLITEQGKQIAEQSRLTGQIMEGMAKLLHIAEIHEARLTRLEGGEV